MKVRIDQNEYLYQPVSINITGGVSINANSVVLIVKNLEVLALKNVSENISHFFWSSRFLSLQ